MKQLECWKNFEPGKRGRWSSVFQWLPEHLLLCQPRLLRITQQARFWKKIKESYEIQQVGIKEGIDLETISFYNKFKNEK